MAREFPDRTLTDEAQPCIVQTGFVDHALELMPLLCNETADGCNANRRVEVWLRMKNSAPGVATAGGPFRKKG